MKSLIRKAQIGDEYFFMKIKEQLPMEDANGKTTNGGFLLGTDIATYRFFIEHAYCLVTEIEAEVVGFGIILPDALVRESDLWQKRNKANWFIDLRTYENQQLSYFEQFAFLKGHKRMAIRLAYHLVKRVFDKGYEFLFTTTVRAPVLNLAAVPFINAIEGNMAGNIDETYPEVGQINSDIYILEAEKFYSCVAEHALYDFLRRSSVVSL